MSNIKTTLHKDYGQGWTPIDALREIISNAFDGETHWAAAGRGRMSVSHLPRSSTLKVRNEGIVVPSKALLMGTSTSRGNDATIGQFGEGLPMALLVLARNGYQVQIDNGYERWTPIIRRSETFDGEPVLVINVRRLRAFQPDFEVRVTGVSLDDWDQVQALFLRLDRSFDPKETVSTEDTVWPRVLLQKQYHGKLYNKGVFVTERNDLMFGYDLAIDLNRDRSALKEEELVCYLRELLHLTASNEDFKRKVVALFAEDSDYLESRSSQDLPTGLLDSVADYLCGLYGDNIVGVDSVQEEAEVRGCGARPIRLRGAALAALHSRTGCAGTVRSRWGKKVAEVIPEDALPSDSRVNFLTARFLVLSSLDKIDWAPNVNRFVPVIFNDQGTNYSAEDNGTVNISVHQLQTLPTALTCMCAAVSRFRWDGASTLLAFIVEHTLNLSPRDHETLLAVLAPPPH